MSKQEIIERNLLSLTRAKSFDKALEDWTVVGRINLAQSRPMATCELCSTPFRSGAMIRHPRPPKAIAVGGTCLTTILRKMFPDPKVNAAHRRDTSNRLTAAYRGAVDPGDWITWVVEHAPRKLAALVVELQHFGMVSSDAGLTTLIRFHDNTRLYPREALLPDWKSFKKARIEIPATLTLTQARQILSKVQASDIEKIVKWRSRQFREDSISPLMAEYEDMLVAWTTLSDRGQRAYLALCALSERRSDKDEPIGDAGMAEGWPPVEHHARFPLFVWHWRFGVGLVEKNGDHSEGMTQILIWRGEIVRRFDVSRWFLLEPPSGRALGLLERAAFLEWPTWSTAPPPPVAAIPERANKVSGASAPTQTAPSGPFDEAGSVLKHPVMRDALRTASFRLRKRKATQEQCMTFVKKRLRELDVPWNDWVWLLDNYDKDAKAKMRVDALLLRL